MKVYIAGPYTKGDAAINVREAILAGDAVFKSGHLPFIPRLTHFWHMVCPAPYEQWIAIDLEWLPCCDVLLRLPGVSSGADNEVTEAIRLGLPVFYSLAQFLSAHGGK